MSKEFKTETIQEFLARGGSIKIVPANASKLAPEQVKPTTGGPAVILTMADAALFYSDGKPKKAVAAKKKGPSVDFEALPEALKDKYRKELLGDGEEDEEDTGE